MKKEDAEKLQQLLHETFVMLDRTDIRGQGNIHNMWNSMNNIQLVSKKISELSKPSENSSENSSENNEIKEE